jgi:hypothetical protein
VPKFEHRLNELHNFHRHEIAVLCVLMLRGPQTPGELRTRAERMHEFEDLDAVHSALNLLMRREPPLVKILPRQPGTKESRYMHLLYGDVAPEEPASAQEDRGLEAAVIATASERIRDLEEEVIQLRRELRDVAGAVRDVSEAVPVGPAFWAALFSFTVLLWLRRKQREAAALQDYL